jgi:GT2 family glycosyltransferase
LESLAVIAFGCSITSPELYAASAAPGIARARERDSRVFALAAVGPIARTYNLILDEAAGLDDLEALVLIHQDAEITDPAFVSQVRDVLRDPQVGVIGAVGVRGDVGLAWWDAELVYASVAYRYGEAGGGYRERLGWEAAAHQPGEVDAVYGVVLVLSPWVVRNVRFDESLGPMYGYDYDLCRQVRAAGRTIHAAPLRIDHRHALILAHDFDAWAAAHARVREKWDRSDDAPDGPQWKQRARAVEANAAAAQLLAASMRLRADADARTNADALAKVAGTRSWQLTKPLRELRLRRSTRAGTTPPPK